MDALIPALLAVLLAETGGRTQQLAHDLALAGRPLASVLGPLALVAMIGLGLASFAGATVARQLTPDARALLAGLSLVMAGLPMLVMRTKPKPLPRYPLLGFAVIHLAEAAPFIAFAIAARTNSPSLAGTGAFIGLMLATLPSILGGADWPGKLPIATMRMIAAFLLTAAGLWLGLGALNLV